MTLAIEQDKIGDWYVWKVAGEQKTKLIRFGSEAEAQRFLTRKGAGGVLKAASAPGSEPPIARKRGRPAGRRAREKSDLPAPSGAAPAPLAQAETESAVEQAEAASPSQLGSGTTSGD